MPEGTKERKELEKMVTKVNALIRGHVERCKFKKLYFLHLVTGKKANQVSSNDYIKVPVSKVLVVNLKE